MKRQIKIKLTFNELSALHQFSDAFVGWYDPVGFSNAMAKELICEINDKMQSMLINSEQKKFTLKLSLSQAMAFIAFWIKIDVRKHPYEMVIINRIIGLIHKSNLYANTFPNADASAAG